MINESNIVCLKKITLNFLDNVSNLTYSHFFEAQLHNFSIYFINVLSYCSCICYLVFHMLFPSISSAVIDFTCITSVSEYSKSIKLLFKWI